MFIKELQKEASSNSLSRLLDQFYVKIQLLEQSAYAYDANGNMTADANKGMSLEYNLLNLPTKATFSGGTIEWIYSASGAKLAKIITVGTGTPTHMRGFSISLVSIINCLIKIRYITIVFLYVTENKIYYLGPVCTVGLQWQSTKMTNM